MIPKVIHYCWFGNNPCPNEVRCYIETWKKFCPDYEIIEWNESNFDITENDYCREAYEAGKWAFVTDYVRLKVLYEHGGFYMDTDVEVVKSLDGIRNYRAVSGYESKTSISTGTMGACRKNEWIGMLLRDYDKRHFLKEDGSYDLTTNVQVITQLTVKKYDIHLNGEETLFGNQMILLPHDYLCAKSPRTGVIKQTQNTYTIHHFSGSWLMDNVRRKRDKGREFYQKMTWIPSKKLRWEIANASAIINVFGWKEFIKKFKNRTKRVIKLSFYE